MEKFSKILDENDAMMFLMMIFIGPAVLGMLIFFGFVIAHLVGMGPDACLPKVH